MIGFGQFPSQARERLREAYDHVRKEWQGKANQERIRTLSAFVRPNLGGIERTPWRRILEPMVAATAAATMVGLAGVSLSAFTLFIVAASLILGILAYVFGIRLDLGVLQQPW